MIKKAASYLVKELKLLGFKVMRYDAYSSKSIYLKLDDGVSGTIRISDHHGKRHLRYRYNLMKNSPRYKEDDKGIVRYYFPMRDIKILVEKINYDRTQLKYKYGELNYKRYMEMNRERGQNSKGFWKSAEYV